MLENTETAIKNEKSREIDKIGYTTRRKTKYKHNMCWTRIVCYLLAIAPYSTYPSTNEKQKITPLSEQLPNI